MTVDSTVELVMVVFLMLVGVAVITPLVVKLWADIIREIRS